MSNLKILVYGEGPTDVGIVSNGQWEEGSVINLIRKINPSKNIVFIPPPPKARVTAIKSTSKRGAPKFEGHGKIIQKLFIYAKKNTIDFDMIVYYGDTDKDSGEKNTEVRARKASEKAYTQANDAFTNLEIEGIPVIPLRMLESWLLSDANAFEQAFSTNRISLPKNPELIWGDKLDPSSNHPKNYLTRVLSTIHLTPSREIFCEITNYINLNTINSACPISFPPFFEVAKRLLN